MVLLNPAALFTVLLYLGSASAAAVPTSSSASKFLNASSTTTKSSSTSVSSAKTSSCTVKSTSSAQVLAAAATSSKPSSSSSASKSPSSSAPKSSSSPSASAKSTVSTSSSKPSSSSSSSSKASSTSVKPSSSSSAPKVSSTSSTVKATSTSSIEVTSSSSIKVTSTSSSKTSVSATSSKTSASASASSTTVTNSTSTLGLGSTFIYDLDNTPIAAPVIKTKSGLSLTESIYIVDMEGSTAAQIANYHAQGKKVGCYFSAGTWEPGRPDALSFIPECYCGPNVAIDSTGKCTGSGSSNNLLADWGEWWLDIHSEKCLTDNENIMTSRIEAAAAKGCDYIDPDNVDSFANTQKFGNTAQDQVNYLLWLSKTAKANGMGLDLKNAGDLITDPDTGKATQWTSSLVAAFDYNVIESCHQYDECDKYDPFLAAGKPQIQIEYSNSITKCPTLASGQKLLVYSGTVVDSNAITLNCQ